MSNSFRFIPLQFDYVARGALHLAEGKTTNILRGALGLELRRTSCPAECRDSRTCPYSLCLYRQFFEGETGGPRPSGYQEPPRAFVLRSDHWAQRTLAAGDHLLTALHLFDLRKEIVDALLLAYSRLGETGLGPGRVPLTLHEIRQPGGRILWNATRGGAVEEPSLASLDLGVVETAPRRVGADFFTPTEIKVRGEIVRDGAFSPLFARLHERIRFLMQHYSNGTPERENLLDAAKKIETVRQDLRPLGVSRYSTRTGQTHPLEGFVGTAIYEGDFTRLWPWLKASEWTGVGRQTVWGKGAVRWAKDPYP